MTYIAPKRFYLTRYVQGAYSIIAEGVEFQDNVVVLRWLSEHPSTVVYNSILDMRAVHCHGGSTRVILLDE